MWLFGRKNKRNDEELLQEYLQTGNKALVGELFETHVKTVYGVCLYYLKDKARAQDAVMQIFEKLMTDLAKTEIKNFKGWLSFVVRNFCINEIRKRKPGQFVPESYLEFEFQETTQDEEERIAKVKEEHLLTNLEKALPSLKEKQRLCVELFYLQQKSYQEITEETGLTLNEVKSYIQNGKRNLKLIIERMSSNSSFDGEKSKLI